MINNLLIFSFLTLNKKMGNNDDNINYILPQDCLLVSSIKINKYINHNDRGCLCVDSLGLLHLLHILYSKQIKNYTNYNIRNCL